MLLEQAADGVCVGLALSGEVHLADMVCFYV